MLRNMATRDLPKWIASFDATEVMETMTVVTLAVQRFRLAHGGSFPLNLDELVPAFLPSQPLDPMDGNPLRYDPRSRRLWSIGDDLTDNGGRKVPTAGNLDPWPGLEGFLDFSEPTIDLARFYSEK